jgi:hypothetical protein
MYVSAISRRTNEMFLIELPYPKSTEVLKSFSDDLHMMVDNLDIIKNRLVILNPNSTSAKKKKKGKTNRNLPNSMGELTRGTQEGGGEVEE